MLRNFIATSVVPFRLASHFLVVVLDGSMCSSDHLLVAEPLHAISCYYFPDGEQLKGGNFGSREFRRLVNVKTEVVLAIAKLGYDTLLVDGDIVFLRDPRPYLTSPEDVQIQRELGSTMNSGFFLVRASEWGLAFLGRALQVASHPTEVGRVVMRQQEAVNRALVMMRRKRATPLTVRVLPMEQFPNGVAYFERPFRRMFAYQNPCDECVIVHNNYIMGTPAKVYRFREHLLWRVDEPEGYYTSTQTRYLEFGNPNPEATLRQEVDALTTAFQLAAILDRVVILPPFHCHGCTSRSPGTMDAVVSTKKGKPQDARAMKRNGCSAARKEDDQCNLSAHFSITRLRSGMGMWPFRERMFRYNPLVPEDIRLRLIPLNDSVNDVDRLQPSPERPVAIHVDPGAPPVASPERVLRPGAPGVALTEDNIRDFFGRFQSERVLRFVDLYGVTLDESAPVFSSTKRKLHSSLRKSGLRSP